MLDGKGSAPLAVLNVVAGVTAAAIAAGAFITAQTNNVVQLPVSVGSILQIVALGGIGIIWWLVRGAFTDLRDRVTKAEENYGKMSGRLSFMEGVCGACAFNTKVTTAQKLEQNDG